MKDYDIGDSVADMHYGIPAKDFDGNPIKVTNVIRLQIDHSNSIFNFIMEQLKKRAPGNPYFVDNKIAKVVGYGNDGQLQAAWTYDDNYFGMFEFEAIDIVDRGPFPYVEENEVREEPELRNPMGELI